MPPRSPARWSRRPPDTTGRAASATRSADRAPRRAARRPCARPASKATIWFRYLLSVDDQRRADRLAALRGAGAARQHRHALLDRDLHRGDARPPRSAAPPRRPARSGRSTRRSSSARARRRRTALRLDLAPQPRRESESPGSIVARACQECDDRDDGDDVDQARIASWSKRGFDRESSALICVHHANSALSPYNSAPYPETSHETPERPPFPADSRPDQRAGPRAARDRPRRPSTIAARSSSSWARKCWRA